MNRPSGNFELPRRSHTRALIGVGSALVFLLGTSFMAFAHGSAETSTASKGPVTITFWEAYSGPLGADLAHLVSEFNASQSQYKVDAVYKGTYPQTMAATIAAFRAHNAPALTMIFDVGTATMQYSKGVYLPVYQLMKKNNIPFATSDFIGGAASYYEDANGNLNSMPFASSTPVLYYNKDMLAKIGATPPKTWQEMGAVGQKLVQAGLTKYGFTIGWPDWTQFEQYAVWNGFHFATNHNGYDGIKGTQVLINTKPFVDHINQLAQWGNQNVFFYGGRESTPDTLFIDGKVGMYIDSSATYAAIAAGAKFSFGESALPYEGGAPGAPQNTVVGGNSLWVMAGSPADVYPGVAKFLQFLMSGKSQAYWASNTGYVPVTQAGVQEMTSNGFYTSHPDAKVAVDELTNKPPTAWSRGIRLGGLPQIRDIENAAITAVFAGKESAQAALDAAAEQANKVLADFASTYGG